MIPVNRRTKVFVCREFIDMRASYDSLFSKVKSILKQDPYSGHLFLFINKKRNSVKCLSYDGTGLVLICKRLDKGTFSKINPFYPNDIAMSQTEFALYFEGADLKKRFIESPKNNRESST